jgi:hypothetical protein
MRELTQLEVYSTSGGVGEGIPVAPVVSELAGVIAAMPGGCQVIWVGIAFTFVLGAGAWMIGHK